MPIWPHMSRITVERGSFLTRVSVGAGEVPKGEGVKTAGKGLRGAQSGAHWYSKKHRQARAWHIMVHFFGRLWYNIWGGIRVCGLLTGKPPFGVWYTFATEDKKIVCEA